MIEFKLAREHRALADRWLAEHEVKGKLLVGFHPGGSTNKNHVHKRWPPEHFIEFGRILVTRVNVSILVFGGPEEDPLKQHIAAGIGDNALCVEVDSIFETAALMAACHQFVSNDSALLHLAGALDVPTWGIFGPTNAQWVRIPGVRRRELILGMPCQPCFSYSPTHLLCEEGDFACLRDLRPDHVADEVISALETSRDTYRAEPSPHE
jgi:heptosyltransferase-2